MPRPRVGEGVRVGTGQWDRTGTVTPNTLTEEIEIEKENEDEKRIRKEDRDVEESADHDTTMLE